MRVRLDLLPLLVFAPEGQVSEWLKEPVSKTGMPVRVSWVRIPPCPFTAVRGEVLPLTFSPLTSYISSMLLLQAFAPGDCILTGLCGVRDTAAGAHSGLLFVALGVVLAGGLGLLRTRRKS